MSIASYPSFLVCWFWCVTINSLRWIGVRQTDAALVACMRKLLITLNSMLKHRSPWRGITPAVVSHSS